MHMKIHRSIVFVHLLIFFCVSPICCSVTTLSGLFSRPCQPGFLNYVQLYKVESGTSIEDCILDCFGNKDCLGVDWNVNTTVYCTLIGSIGSTTCIPYFDDGNRIILLKGTVVSSTSQMQSESTTKATPNLPYTNVTTEKSSTDPSTKQGLNDQTTQQMSTDQTTQQMSTEQTTQQMSTEKTTQQMSTEQIAEQMSTEQTTATISTEGSTNVVTTPDLCPSSVCNGYCNGNGVCTCYLGTPTCQCIGGFSGTTCSHDNGPETSSTLLSVSNGYSDGSWGSSELCDTGYFAQGFDLKVDDSIVLDKTAVNAIKLYCRHALSYAISHNRPASAMALWGDWENPTNCAKTNYWISRFRMFSVPAHGGDDSATNNIEVECRGPGFDGNNTHTIRGSGISFDNAEWGSWSGICPSGEAVCGIRTKVESNQGPFKDDAGLTDVKLQCCGY